jgi:hypothetical protein
MLKRINFISSLVVLLVFISIVILREHPGLGYEPGEHPLLGLVGVIFLFLSLIYSLLKRAPVFKNIKGFWADLHVFLGLVGVLFILFHSAGRFFSFYGLLALSIIILFLLGANLRIPSAHLSSQRFGSKAKLFLSPIAHGDEKLEALITAKRSLLRILNPSADEGTFNLRFRDWLSSPIGAVGYLSLSIQERRLIRKKLGVDPWYFYLSHRYGRFIHIILAAIVVLWFLIHAIDLCEYFQF